MAGYDADSLKLELKRLLTVILAGDETKESDDGFLKAISEAITILTLLSEAEIKKPSFSPSSLSVDEALRILKQMREYDLPSAYPPPLTMEDVPEEFTCMLSNAIMIEPVLIASGHTFEKRYITEYLKHASNCPRTKEPLSHGLCTPNHSLDVLIAKWYQDNGYTRPKPAITELPIDGLKSTSAQPVVGRLVTESGAGCEVPKQEALEALNHAVMSLDHAVQVLDQAVEEAMDQVGEAVDQVGEAMDQVMEAMEQAVELHDVEALENAAIAMELAVIAMEQALIRMEQALGVEAMEENSLSL